MQYSGRLALQNIIPVLAGIAALASLHSTAHATFQTPPVLSSIAPAEQVVHGILTLHGSNFGAYQNGVTDVLFRPAGGLSVGGMNGVPPVPNGASADVSAGTPYVWRDDFIQVRVPVGRTAGGVIAPIPKVPLKVVVVTANGESNSHRFRVTYEPGSPPLTFTERTTIVQNEDTSGFLGTVAHNRHRVKDGEVADVNGDGLPDLLDHASNNILNGTHEVLRLNRGGGLGFDSSDWEPLFFADPGTFSVTVLVNGDFYGDGICYDADFADLDNDGLVDWIQAVGQATGRLRVALNNHLGVPGDFIEATSTWVQQPPDKSLDDIAHTDINQDGFVDIATAARFSTRGFVYVNDAGQAFRPPVTVQAPSGSIHDIFLIDSNLDGFGDVVLVNESGSARLYLNDGNALPAFNFSVEFSMSSFAGGSADLNGDGWPDIVLVGSGQGRVFWNPGTSGTWDSTLLPGPVELLYDIEMGDIDLDGDVDLIGASITTFAQRAASIWTNDGNQAFTNYTRGDATQVLPGLGPYQRLSADLIDYDQDGDLDLYITGADGQDAYGGGFGRVPNQFYENQVR